MQYSEVFGRVFRKDFGVAVKLIEDDIKILFVKDYAALCKSHGGVGRGLRTAVFDNFENGYIAYFCDVFANEFVFVVELVFKSADMRAYDLYLVILFAEVEVWHIVYVQTEVGYDSLQRFIDIEGDKPC